MTGVLRQLFETTVERCIAEGLVGGEGIVIDGIFVRDDVNRQHAVDEAGGLPDRAISHNVREYLVVRDDAASFSRTLLFRDRLTTVFTPEIEWIMDTTSLAGGSDKALGEHFAISRSSFRACPGSYRPVHQ